jgi:hypothetical protein
LIRFRASDVKEIKTNFAIVMYILDFNPVNGKRSARAPDSKGQQRKGHYFKTQ